MKISADNLAGEGYVQLDSFSHNDMVVFIRKQMKRRTPISITYQVFNAVMLGLLVYLILIWKNNGQSLADLLMYAGGGVFLAFLLIPIHEVLHALAYKAVGAQQVSFGADWRRLVFFALAHRFVVNRREFWIVAFTPFVVISCSLAIALLASNSAYQVLWCAMLLFHGAICSGDFGISNMFWSPEGENMVSFDDKTNHTTYFYVKSSMVDKKE